MRWLLVTLLLLSLGATYPRHRRFLQPNLPGRSSESPPPPWGGAFALTLDLGDEACACEDVAANITRDGVSSVAAVTVTAATPRPYCTKGNEISGIANGDLVMCGANKPRVMRGKTGTGNLGLAVRRAHQNRVVRSQEFCNASWTTPYVIGVDIICTENVAVAPDGTTTADLLSFNVAESSWNQVAGCLASEVYRTVYARLPVAPLPDGGTPRGAPADGGAYTRDNLFVYSGGGIKHPAVTITSESWTRIVQNAPTDVSAGYRIEPMTAMDVYLWGGDCQRNINLHTAGAQPHIPTAGAVVTSSDEVLEITGVTVPTAVNISITADALVDGSPVFGTVVDLNESPTMAVSNKLVCGDVGGPPNTATSGGAISSSASNSVSCTYDLGYMAACANGSCADAGVAALGAATPITIGSRWNGAIFQEFLGGVVKNLVIASTEERHIYLVGDSIVAGDVPGDGFRPQDYIKAALGSTVAVTNLGVSAHTSASCKTVFDNKLAAIVAAGTEEHSTILVQCGINDCPAGAATAITNLKAMLTAGKAARVNLLWATVTPYAAVGSCISTINTEMLTWTAANSIRSANTFNTLQSGGALNPTYDSGDGQHPNATGTQAMTLKWIASGGW